MDAIRAQTPPELQYLVDDGFNRIVLYDNTAVSATSEKTPNGKYKVTLEVQARKVQADGNGAETPLPLADYIEIGVFSGKKDEEKPLYLKKEKLTEEGRADRRQARGGGSDASGHDRTCAPSLAGRNTRRDFPTSCWNLRHRRR